MSSIIPGNSEMLTPWQILDDTPEMRGLVERLSAHLQSDIPPQHLLYGVKAIPVARRVDRDDVLFHIDGGKMPLAVVHMTWRREKDPRWPKTEMYGSWQDWVNRVMVPAHAEYLGGEKDTG